MQQCVAKFEVCCTLVSFLLYMFSILFYVFSGHLLTNLIKIKRIIDLYNLLTSKGQYVIFFRSSYQIYLVIALSSDTDYTINYLLYILFTFLISAVFHCTYFVSYDPGPLFLISFLMLCSGDDKYQLVPRKTQFSLRKVEVRHRICFTLRPETGRRYNNCFFILKTCKVNVFIV